MPRSLDGQVHLWISSIQRLLEDPRALAGCTRLLDSGERARNARFRREEDRLRDVLARALVRTVLSVYAPVAPACWRFERDARGRIQVAEPERQPRLHFSLSHGDDLVACAVADRPGVGVDVERVELSAAVPTALAPRERREPDLFFSYWTLREAYGKALGTGLTGLGEDLWFELEGESGARLYRPDEDRRWWFQRLAPAAGYLLAVALEVDPGETPRLVRQGAAPLPGW